MTNEEKKALYSCSIQGYLKYFKENNYDNIKDAIKGSIKYLIRCGVDEELTDCSRNELIYVIKNEIAKMVAKNQLNNNPNDLTNMHSEDEKDIQSFLKDPSGYIGSYLKKNENEFKIDRKNIVADDEDRLARKYNKNINEVARLLVISGVKTVYNVYANHQNENKSYHIINQLEANLPDNSIDEAFEKQKPGTFEKFFKTTSKEYINFKEAFANYRDINNPFNGNDNYLRDAAMGYIRHKFPNLKDDNFPTKAEIDKLSGAGKERVAFCLNVINVLKENSAIQEQAFKLTEAIDKIEVVKENINDDNFHNDLKEDVNDIQKNNKVDIEISNEEMDNSLEVE